MFLVDVLSGLLRPISCLACGVPGAWPCCDRCLPPDPGDVGPWPLAADPDLVCWALGPYRDALRAAVLAGKFDGQPAALAELGRRLGAAMAAAGAGADLVTYVAARRAAGYPRDHAERIARGVAGALDVPAVDLLAPARGRDLGRARRAGRSPLPQPPTRPPPVARRRLAGGRVLLVDDLATTGATLAGAAAALHLAGARRVEAAVLATAPTALASAAAAPGGFGAPAAATGTPRAPPSRPSAAARHRLVTPAPWAQLGSRPGRPATPWPSPSRPARCRPRDPLGASPAHRPCSWRSHCVVVTRFRV
jgi:predicted amidophosphoribosyltransferase